MFQVLVINSPTQSLPFTTNSPSIPSSNRIPRRSFAVRCRTAIPNESTGCLISTHNSSPVSLYEILSVNQNASVADIKSAYRRLAKIYHPDANLPEFDGSDFIQINNAYETLSDPKSRAIYDGSIGLVGRRNVARSAGGTTSFGCYASCSSIGRRPGFYPTRRWESDQCW